MAGEERAPADRLNAQLTRRARQFSFFQLVQLLERGTGSVPLGYQGPARDERIRFRAEASLAFPSSDVTAVRPLPPDASGRPRYEVTVSFLGLYGPASPLPAHYTEAVIAADLDDTNRRDFLDYFHQRLLSFFYRTWKKYRYFANFRPGASDPFSRWVFALMGLSPEIRAAETQLRWPRLLACTGLLSISTCPNEALEKTVSFYFGGVPARVEPFAEHWVVIEPDQRARLGVANTELARDVVIGMRVRDRSGKFRLVLGLLLWDQVQRFLPIGEDFVALRELLLFMLTDPLKVDLVLRLRREAAKPLDLAPDNPCRLGWTTWLGHPAEPVLGIRLALC